MGEFIGFFLTILSFIYAFIFLIYVYHDTIIDIFQEPLNPGEKEQFFIDPALNPNKTLKYDRQCQMYQDLIMQPSTKKLGDVFKLNYEPIHNNSYYIIIINIFIIFSYTYFILAICAIKFFPDLFFSFGSIKIIFNVTIYIAALLESILFLLVLYYFYSGDTYSYNNFLECRNVNYPGFVKFKNIERFKSDFSFFVFFNVINALCKFFYKKK